MGTLANHRMECLRLAEDEKDSANGETGCLVTPVVMAAALFDNINIFKGVPVKRDDTNGRNQDRLQNYKTTVCDFFWGKDESKKNQTRVGDYFLYLTVILVCCFAAYEALQWKKNRNDAKKKKKKEQDSQVSSSQSGDGTTKKKVCNLYIYIKCRIRLF